MRRIPFSLGFFVIAAGVFALQMIPIVGIVMMFMLAPFWSVLLINAGMLGTAFEALSKRVSRGWLLLPVLFYGTYFGFAALDHATLAKLGHDFDATNAKVAVPFDPQHQALAFEGDGQAGSWYVQNFALPVAYSRSKQHPEGFRSNRMMETEVCAKVRGNQSLSAAQIYTFGFHDGDAINDHKFEKRFCDLSMPERPELPVVSVTHKEEQSRYGSLPITKVTTTVATPDGQSFTLLGGVAAPLSWIPMPVMGCALNSGGPSWNCGAEFWRNGFTPIVSGKTRFSRDSLVLAKALGLKAVSIEQRKGGDVSLVLAKMAKVEAETLARQLAAIDRMIADPLGKADWDTGVLANNPEQLANRAEAIMSGLERAAAANDEGYWKARESGRVLARLIANLPPERLRAFSPRILRLYRANFSPRSDQYGSRGESHWLWECETLLRRLGDLGPEALFVITDPRASNGNVNAAGVEAMCRIGVPARDQAAPVLLTMWSKADRLGRNERRALFVAMRRIGIEVPPIAESEADQVRRERANKAMGGWARKQQSPMDELLAEWSDVSPTSPPNVCSPGEWQARRKRG